MATQIDPPPSYVEEFNGVWRTWLSLLFERVQESITEVPASETEVYTGSLIGWTTSTPPTGYLECDGSALSTTTYADLYNIIGYTYGGSGATFNLPDYRGEFLRGWDNGAANDPDAATRTDRGDGTTGDNIGTKQDHQLDSHRHSATTLPAYDAGAGTNLGHTNYPGASSTKYTNYTGGNETRPRNVNVMYCIKY